MQEREVTLPDGARVLLRELSMFETMTANGIARRFSHSGKLEEDALMFSYAICSIRRINGEDVHPLKGEDAFAKVGGRIPLSHAQVLIEAFSEMVGPPGGENLKNGSEVPTSD